MFRLIEAATLAKPALHGVEIETRPAHRQDDFSFLAGEADFVRYDRAFQCARRDHEHNVLQVLRRRRFRNLSPPIATSP
jgi:hypothetical protein